MTKKVQDTSNRKSDLPVFFSDTDGIQQLRDECLVLLQTMANLSVVVTGLTVLLGREIDRSSVRSMDISVTKLAQHIMPSVLDLYESARDMEEILKSSAGRSQDLRNGQTKKSRRK